MKKKNEKDKNESDSDSEDKINELLEIEAN
jgi:hypothetical protein